MEVFINGTSAISSQSSFNRGGHYLDPWVENEASYFKCLEPNYKEIINPRLLRRMSRIIKMGVATALKSLEDADIEQPESIIVGTGLGCLTDTEKFLHGFATTEQEGNGNMPLSPTPFIQSTHNTIAGQISLLLKSHAYAFTYSQRGHSFENALEDAIIQVSEGKKNVLVGGLDEMIPYSHQILAELNCPAILPPQWGEGASFFILSNEKTAGTYGAIQAFETLYSPENNRETISWLENSLEKADISPDQIDAILIGFNGNTPQDKVYHHITQTLFEGKPIVHFKKVSGEYFTASAFGLNLGANMIKSQKFYPQTLAHDSSSSEINNLLVYNHFNNKYHSLSLLKKC